MIKYAKATKLKISIDNRNDFKMIIQDNGVGKQKSSRLSGQGLENMRERAKELNGEIAIQFIEGCQITLTCAKI